MYGKEDYSDGDSVVKGDDAGTLTNDSMKREKMQVNV